MNIADNHWLKSISLRRRDLGLGALALGAAATLPRSSVADSRAEKLGQFLKGELGELRDLKDDVKEEVAYLLGMECYVYGFPLVLMDVTNGVVTASLKVRRIQGADQPVRPDEGLCQPGFQGCRAH